MSSNKQNKLTWQEYKQIIAVSFTLINTMMGVALLTLSFTFSRIGLICAYILLTLEMLFSLWGFLAINELTHHLQLFTSREIFQTLFGRTIAYFIDVCIVLQYTGYLIAYYSVIGDYISAFINGVSKYEFDSMWIKIIAFPILFCISCSGSLKLISQISAFAYMFIIVAIIVILVLFGLNIPKNEMEMAVGGHETIVTLPFPKFESLLWPIQQNVPSAIAEFILRTPLMMPLYGVQMSLPIIQRDIVGQPQIKRKMMDISTVVSTVLAYIFYLAVSVCCYFMFGRHIQGNVLLSFPPALIVMSVIRLLYAINIGLSFSIVVYPVRTVLLDWCRLKREGDKARPKLYKTIFIIIALVLTGVSLGISIIVPSVVEILNFASSIFGIGLYYVQPLLAIWYVPYARAHSRVLLNDNIDAVNDDRRMLQRQSFAQITARLSMHVDKMAHPKELEILDKSDLIIPRKDQVRMVMQRQRAGSVFNKEIMQSFDFDSIKQAKFGSIDISKPAHCNDLFVDTFQRRSIETEAKSAKESIKQSEEGQQSHLKECMTTEQAEEAEEASEKEAENRLNIKSHYTQELPEETDEDNEVTISIANQFPDRGQDNQEPEQISEQQCDYDERSQKEMKKMTKCRAGTIIFFISVAVVYNLCAFGIMFKNNEIALSIVQYI